jgi:putative ubiquitin-RnfH superfamily antitoxin RatB of RatAB toxin-antitoxin module
MSPRAISVELVYATRERQMVRKLSLPTGATVADAIAAAPGVVDASVAGAVDMNNVGIWGRVVDPQCPLRDGDRIEFLRRLMVDPKDARRRRDEVSRRKR